VHVLVDSVVEIEGVRVYGSPWVPKVCCSVLQCVALCCSVIQYAAVCCSVLQCVAVRVYGFPMITKA